MSLKPWLVPDSLAGRVAVILIVGIVMLHIISLGSYDLDRVAVLGDAGMDRLAERVASAVRLSEYADAGKRAALVERLSNTSIAIDWSQNALTLETGKDDASQELVSELADWLAIPKNHIHVSEVSNDDTITSVQLSDGSWVNAKAAPFLGDDGDLTTLIWSTSFAAFGIIAFSLLMVRWVTLPLRRLSDAADQLGVKLDSPALAVKGSAEVRRAAVAFNSMQSRVQRFVTDRTQMFAAISHDLKTPITRLKLRAEFVEDEGEKTRMLRDLDDMEGMVASLLDFLRDETNAEETRRADIVAITRTICDDFSDAGNKVTLGKSPQSCTVLCRAGALKRAISNVIDNAVKYGGLAEIEILNDGKHVSIFISDAGPGIPPDSQEQVFAPFYRMEQSRNRGTGGTGLGLTIARTIIRSHGGELTLKNMQPLGLRVEIVLPLLAAVKASVVF